MKLSLILCTLVVGLGLAAPTAGAQSCPYTVSITSYGSPCSNLTASTPSLIGNFPIGNDCHVGFFHVVPTICCNVILTHRWFVVGLSQASLPLPGGGCPLLVSPLIIVEEPALDGTVGLQLLLPPNPALIGLTVYAQGIDRRFDTLGFTQHFETTNGLALLIQ